MPCWLCEIAYGSCAYHWQKSQKYICAHGFTRHSTTVDWSAHLHLSTFWTGLVLSLVKLWLESHLKILPKDLILHFCLCQRGSHNSKFTNFSNDMRQMLVSFLMLFYALLRRSAVSEDFAAVE